MFKKLITEIKNTIIEEYKFIIALLLLYSILQIPLNYYIVIGGGVSDVAKRIKVEDKYNSKGSFNISYVSELEGTILTYALSYIIPSWEREDADNYKYNANESIEDIDFRSDIDLKYANEKAKYWAYTLADKEVQEVSSKLYIITIFDGYETDLKVQDQILSMDNQSYKTIKEYQDYLQTKEENEFVEIKVLRNNKEKVVKSKLYKYKDRLILGIGLELIKEYKTDPKVKVKFKKSESGPSAGLIATLEIYNQLTKKDLTKGYKIAGTGTIEEDGTIGEIGGITYKLLGASKSKTDIFLVPADNYQEALKYKKKHHLKIKLIKVKNIESAINKLEELK
ncbi:MAG: hypothetical protein IJG97_03010 [Bacilli bacterium]|nr:hypothetical protein [Bacilli bacterium]